jgi:Activator of Hsp90 ATPase homolog 1-like protein
MTQTEVTVRRYVVVDAAIDRAFAAFTKRFGDFKPREHNMLSAPIAETIYSNRELADTSSTEPSTARSAGGRVLVYEPPTRVVFSWDISPRWSLVTDPEMTSEVEVRFNAVTPQRTRVDLEHRRLDRHGPGWQLVAEGLEGDDGWPHYLARYAALLVEDR